MEQRRLIKSKLGETGLVVSRLGLGTVKFGRNTGLKYPSHFNLPRDNDILRLLEVADELGINYLDTAPAYGVSEARIGKLLTGDMRDKFMIFTKVGERYEDGVSTFDFSRGAVRRSVEKSCKRLRCEVLDVVCIHSDGKDEGEEKFGDAFAALGELKDEGVVRAVGMSAKTMGGARLAAERGDVVMLTLNERDKKMIPFIRDAGIGVIIKKGFASGWFGGDADGKDEAKGKDDPVRQALGFVFGTEGVTTMVTGTLNGAHLRRSVEIIEGIERGFG